MNTAYRSQSAICRLDHLVDAEWLDSPNATLRLLFAAPGFGELRTVDVIEPYASAIWRAVCPAEEPAPTPTAPPRQRPPEAAQDHGPAAMKRFMAEHPLPAPAPPVGALGMPTSYSPGYRSGNGGSALPTKYPPKPRVDAPPTRASQLYPWAMKTGERCQIDLVDYLQEWGKMQRFPAKFKDWSDREVAEAVKETALFLQEQGVSP